MLSRLRYRARARYALEGGGGGPIEEPDFSLDNLTVTTSNGVETVGSFIFNDAVPAGAFVVLVNEDAGFGVVNG